ncbi:MAG: ribosome biogenesis GTP-binding protein YihA/YsxC [Candidatus Omnitrophota bacterium]
MKILNSQLEKTSFTEKELSTGDHTPKVVFVGRSNVGKSSLINKLVGRKNMARTSSKPGKTVSVNYYRIAIPGTDFYFVDLPGYGYAKISKSESRRVKSLISAFFKTVENVKLVVLLVDARHGFMVSDLDVISEILDKNFRLLTVLTKSDKLRYSELISQKKDLQKKFDLNVISFTIKSEENKEEMLNLIHKALME